MLNNIKTSILSFWKESRSAPDGNWKIAFLALAAGTCPLMLRLSLDFGIIWDEWIQSHYGKLVLKFLLSAGQDQSALSFGKTMYLYGGLFDTLTAALYGLIFDRLKNVTNYPVDQDLIAPHWHTLRHIVNSLFGFTAILFTGLAAKKIAGWRAGTLAFLLLLLSPRFFGNAMNNPKDIPFAAGAAVFLYFMIQLLQELPSHSRRTIAGTGIGIAIAINIKVGGILFLAYVWLFCGLLWLKSTLHMDKTFNFSKLLSILIPISLIGYLGGLIFWPYGMLNPLLNPLKAFKAFSAFGGNEGTLLFEGLNYFNGTTPWYYLPKWILISNPLFFLFSLILFGLAFKAIEKMWPAKIVRFVLFCGLFPIVWAILTHTIVYDGWRHFTFVYPPLIIIAALAWEYLLRSCAGFYKKTAAGILLFFFMLDPLAWMIANHPNQTVYFNALVGGVRGAQGKYEMDYWGNCLRQASEGFATEFKNRHAPAPVVIRSDGEPISSMPYLIRSLGSYYVPHNPGTNEWDFSIEMARFKNPLDIQSGAWPGPQTVYAVKADQVPLCAVIQNKKPA